MNRCRLPLVRWVVLHAVLVLVGALASTTNRGAAVQAFPAAPAASLTTRRAVVITNNDVTDSASCARLAVVRRAGFFPDDLFGPGRTPKVPRSPRERYVRSDVELDLGRSDVYASCVWIVSYPSLTTDPPPHFT